MLQKIILVLIVVGIFCISIGFGIKKIYDFRNQEEPRLIANFEK